MPTILKAIPCIHAYSQNRSSVFQNRPKKHATVAAALHFGGLLVGDEDDREGHGMAFGGVESEIKLVGGSDRTRKAVPVYFGDGWVI